RILIHGVSAEAQPAPDDCSDAVPNLVRDIMLLSNAQILDVVEGTYLPDRFVLIHNGRISDITERRPHHDGPEFDLKGRTLMPGLCDGHVHVTAITADFAKLNRTPPSYVASQARHILHGMLMRGFTTV